MADLLDVNAWLPLGAPDHVHHARARRYWDEESADTLAFCRATSLAFLRLLTNRHVMGTATLAGLEAWAALDTWYASPRVVALAEPTGLDEVLGHWSQDLDTVVATGPMRISPPSRRPADPGWSPSTATSGASVVCPGCAWATEQAARPDAPSGTGGCLVAAAVAEGPVLGRGRA